MAAASQEGTSAAATRRRTDGTSSSATTSWTCGAARAAASVWRRAVRARASAAWAASDGPSGAPWRAALRSVGDERRDTVGGRAAVERGERVGQRDAERGGLGDTVELGGEDPVMAPPDLAERAARA